MRVKTIEKMLILMPQIPHFRLRRRHCPQSGLGCNIESCSGKSTQKQVFTGELPPSSPSLALSYARVCFRARRASLRVRVRGRQHARQEGLPLEHRPPGARVAQDPVHRARRRHVHAPLPVVLDHELERLRHRVAAVDLALWPHLSNFLQKLSAKQ